MVIHILGQGNCAFVFILVYYSYAKVVEYCEAVSYQLGDKACLRIYEHLSENCRKIVTKIYKHLHPTKMLFICKGVKSLFSSFVWPGFIVISNYSSKPDQRYQVSNTYRNKAL